jgi:CubicO group peptidase (beta-lactamase class C family)
MADSRMNKLTDADFARIRSTVQSLVAEHHLPGIAVGVVQGDELVFAEGFGHADIEANAPMTPDHRQRIGSITKTFTALCVMALVDEGRLSLDDRVVDLLPDMPFDGPAEALTIKHLLKHTGGIGEAPTRQDLPRLIDFLYTLQPDASRIPQAYPNGITIEVPPGTKWAYANHGYALLGEVIMRLEDATIDQVMRRRIFGPLGMTNSDCLDEPHVDLPACYHRAQGDEERVFMERLGRQQEDGQPVDGHNIRGRHEYIRGMSRRAAGGVQATIPDMARYASALLRKGGGIVRSETFKEMVAPQWCPDDRLSSQGFGFVRNVLCGRRTISHGGGINGGWNSHLTVFPDDGIAVLQHLNLTSPASAGVFSRITQAVLDAPSLEMPDLPFDETLLAAAPGVFEAPLPGPLTNFRIMTSVGRAQISSRDGQLWLHVRRGPWKDGARMLPADANDPTFFVLDTGEPDPPRVALVRNASGAVTALRLPGLMELVRTETVAPWV